MARSPAEIQADIALTRQRIEERLEAFDRRVLRQWWAPWTLLLGGLVLGLLLARVPARRLLGIGTRTVQAGLAVAGTVEAVDRFLARRRAARVA